MRSCLNRGPRAPNEDRRRYEERLRFARRFDAFVRESGVTEDQEQALLLTIYDYVVAVSPHWEPLWTSSSAG